MLMLTLSALFLLAIPVYRCWRQNGLLKRGQPPAQLYEPLGRGLPSYLFGTTFAVFCYCVLGGFAQTFSGGNAWLANGGTMVAILSIAALVSTLWWSTVVSVMRPQTA